MIGGGFVGSAAEGMPVPTAEGMPVPMAEDGGGGLDLPPGFRFHPTDEEIITEYLVEKARNKGFNPRAVGEVDLNKNEPWELPSKAKMGEKEWYFFCRKDKKYPTGMRTNRATESGYWKATGKDKEIYGRGNDGCLVGMKKTLVFYKGRAPNGEKTSWVMHEYRLEGRPSSHHDLSQSQDLWVVCRVFHKSAGAKKPPPAPFPGDAAGDAEKDVAGGAEASFRDDFLVALSTPPLVDDGGYGGDLKPAVPSVPMPGSTFYLPSVASLQDFGAGAYSDMNDYQLNLESQRQEPVLYRQALSSSPPFNLLQMPGDDRPPSTAGQASMYLQDTFWDY